MLFSAPFAVSQNQADASYIEQLGLSFIALRLNVTPETVDAQHAQLLRYVFPGRRTNSRFSWLKMRNELKTTTSMPPSI
jgi:conjugal transfer pilus assembly protein TraE